MGAGDGPLAPATDEIVGDRFQFRSRSPTVMSPSRKIRLRIKFWALRALQLAPGNCLKVPRSQ